MTHAEAINLVHGKTNRKSRKVGNNTYAEIMSDGSVGITLHSTMIVRIHPDNSATLNTGGWHTSTTKDRMNKYSPVRVYQKKGEWYLNNDENTPYEDGMNVKDDKTWIW
jgi:hypothetical protein